MTEEIEKEIIMSEELFGEVVTQVGILKEIYDKIAITREMSFFQKKVTTQNKKQNIEVLNKLEDLCNSLE